jgi:hypothetical protein
MVGMWSSVDSSDVSTPQWKNATFRPGTINLKATVVKKKKRKRFSLLKAHRPRGYSLIAKKKQDRIQS